ncbi:MAG TPA: hypothetical protein VH394_26590 [Thermoanaerobaculia bacterium]|nr:hypothetical protein [Thermoanaerobaculia bacterium]
MQECKNTSSKDGFQRSGDGAQQATGTSSVMIGGLVTSTLFTLLALPTFYQWVHRIQDKVQAKRVMKEAA